MDHAETETIRIAAPAQPLAVHAASAWPPGVLSGIERELARHVGPLAQTLVRRAAQQHTTTLALIAALLPSIESAQEREAFSRTCTRRALVRSAALAVPAPALPLTPQPTAPPAPEPTPAPARAPARAATPLAADAGTPLLRAAEALLGALPQLRTIDSGLDAAALQAQLLQHLAAFEAAAAASGVSSAHLAVARGLLCNVIDEAVADSPWGLSGRWAAHALTPPAAGADALDLLPALLADPQAHAPLIELFYVCIALGFEGRLHNTPQARVQLAEAAARLHARLPTRRGRAGGPRTLSPHWRGLATRGHRDLALLPLWVVVASCGALVLALWLVLNARLDARAHPVFSRLAAAPAALQSAAAVAATKPRLSTLLPADVRIEVRDEAQRSLITLPADSLFVADSARLAPQAASLLAGVARALRGQATPGGEVSVIGHGDDSAPASLQFPTGWHLTRARAQAVADVLAAQHVPAARAEGRAEFEPRAPNTTPAGRAQNRRIDIELRLPRPEA